MNEKQGGTGFCPAAALEFTGVMRELLRLWPAEAVALDDDGLGVVEEAVEEG